MEDLPIRGQFPGDDPAEVSLGHLTRGLVDVNEPPRSCFHDHDRGGHLTHDFLQTHASDGVRTGDAHEASPGKSKANPTLSRARTIAELHAPAKADRTGGPSLGRASTQWTLLPFSRLSQHTGSRVAAVHGNQNSQEGSQPCQINLAEVRRPRPQ